MTGQRLDWLIVAGAAVVCVLLFPFGPAPLASGARVEVEVGVTPADAVELQCAGAAGAESCALDAQKQPVATERPLRPFVTTWRQLVLVSGVFESDAAKEWLRRPAEPATFRCDATVLSQKAEVELRFHLADQFGRHTIPALSADSCRRVR